MAKKSPDAFTSFRVLGQKAQQLLLKTTQELKHRRDASASLNALPDAPDKKSTLVRFSPLNIFQGTLVIVLTLTGVLAVVTLWDKIFLLFLGFFVAAIIDPGVRALERMGVPRGLGILLQYIVALVIFLFLVISLIPTIAQQLQLIAELVNKTANDFIAQPTINLPLVGAEMNANLTRLIQNTLQNLSITQFTDALKSFGTNMQSIVQGTASIAGKVGLTIMTFFIDGSIVLILAFFIQIERENLHAWFRGFFRSSHRSVIDIKLDAIHEKISMWARGQIILGVTVAILVYIALKILRIPNAETLAVLAGFTEFIPYVGPIIAAVPALLIALTQDQGGFMWALIVAGVYYVIQWCENNLLVPLIMKRAVGLSPIAVIFAMLAGLSLPKVFSNPILGLLLAVPITTIIAIFLNDLRRGPQVPPT